MVLAFGRSFGGRWPGAGLAPQVGAGLATGRDFAAGQVGAGLVVGRGQPQPPCEDPQPGQRCQRPHGAVLPVPRGVRTAIPEPELKLYVHGCLYFMAGFLVPRKVGDNHWDGWMSVLGVEKEWLKITPMRSPKRSKGQRKIPHGACIGREKSKAGRGSRKKTERVDGVMKHHTLQECYVTNSSISSQMDFS
ncbi:small VCP/p97-interacting protein isoform X2 [Alexandromys fortis]|uniref:small VCP/p97-interacting protein isoform X2 n=1 Tax=Alexandromys fortis TaxID=100897 RepID=UPI0021532D88|nr:small VCP/p97-interacting protein isoform X2 [Microtus fortis]